MHFLSAAAWRGMLRFRELNRQMPEITQATLTKELRRLESFQLINRKVYPEIPPRAEYSLTENGVETFACSRHQHNS